MLELLSTVKVRNKGVGQLRGRSHPVKLPNGRVIAPRYDVLIEGVIYPNIDEEHVELVAKPTDDEYKRVIR